jgi:putative transposase
VSLLHAHLVFVTKYRRGVFTDAMLTYREHNMRGVCAKLDVELVELVELVKLTMCTCWPRIRKHSRFPFLPNASKGRTAYARYAASSPVAVSAPASADTSGRRPTSPSPVTGAPLSIIKQYIDGQARPL